MKEIPPFNFRKVVDGDLPFIYSSWLKSYRQSDYAKNLTNDVFFGEHKKLIERILASETTQIIMLVNVDDADQIYGFIVAEHRFLKDPSDVVHYCYLKYNFRKFGIMSDAISKLGLLQSHKLNYITHIPRDFSKLVLRYNLSFNPYLLMSGGSV